MKWSESDERREARCDMWLAVFLCIVIFAVMFAGLFGAAKLASARRIIIPGI